ncbi:MAG: T9SS C-terminal target domain-containing protein [Chitinophagaceae bacterium]|nr:MAG: T9SS C-terminal target domain-containing protein [Chitinophagaceae bacterium]
MRSFFLLFLLLGFADIFGYSQTFLTFTVDQPEPLTVEPESQFFIVQPDDIPFSIGDIISVSEGNSVSEENHGYIFLWTPGTILSEDDVLNPSIVTMGMDNTSDTLLLTVTDDKECVQYSRVVVNYEVPMDDTVYINQLNVLEKAKIYPNPLKDALYIEFESGFSNYINQLQIYDNQNRLIYTKAIKRNPNSETLSIDFSARPAGIYQLILISENQQFFHSLIKE